MKYFWTYYIICLIYCFIQAYRNWWSKNSFPGGIGITPGLDSLLFVALCWVLAPIDLAFTLARLYTEYRINNRSKL